MVHLHVCGEGDNSEGEMVHVHVCGEGENSEGELVSDVDEGKGACTTALTECCMTNRAALAGSPAFRYRLIAE